MNIVKYFTLVALAAAALGVSACAKKGDSSAATAGAPNDRLLQIRSRP